MFVAVELLKNPSHEEKNSSQLTNATVTDNNMDITYYIRLRAFDERNNTADWSNVVSASFLKPEALSTPVSQLLDVYLMTLSVYDYARSMITNLVFSAVLLCRPIPNNSFVLQRPDYKLKYLLS